MDEKTASQLLDMMADEEKQLRDELKKLQRGRQPRVEKDW